MNEHLAGKAHFKRTLYVKNCCLYIKLLPVTLLHDFADAFIENVI